MNRPNIQPLLMLSAASTSKSMGKNRGPGSSATRQTRSCVSGLRKLIFSRIFRNLDLLPRSFPTNCLTWAPDGRAHPDSLGWWENLAETLEMSPPNPWVPWLCQATTTAWKRRNPADPLRSKSSSTKGKASKIKSWRAGILLNVA